jgi:orotidine-5'-phosphate decarboxylase
MTFNEKFTEICDKKKSHLCVGIDVDINKIPPFLLHAEDPLFEFSSSIIKSTQEYAAAFKINTAFFEAYGISGWRALTKLVKILPNDVIKIADAKRADIGNTSRMYAKAFFNELPFDVMTVNPYLGYDAISPFIEDEKKGVFVLCVTSNQGSFDFQRINDGKKMLFEHIAEKVNTWNTNKNCGLVVGATHATELKKVREIATNLPFLIPGIGAQGGDLELSVKYSLNSPQAMAIFNSSRGIIYSSHEKNFAEVAAEKSMILRDTINSIKSKLGKE